MKVSIERDEIKGILTAAIGAKFGGKWDCTTSDYHLPRDVEFVQETSEYLAEKERERIESERITAEWKAKDEDDRAAKEAA